MAKLQATGRKWLRLGNWSLLIGCQPHGPVLKRYEHARQFFWRIWRWFPGGFGSNE